MTVAERWLRFRGPGLWLMLALPPSRHLLESAMTLQMLIQMPLLVIAGWWLCRFLPPRFDRSQARWNRSGITGLVLASLTAMVWMLPRSMDAALEVPWVEAAKFISLPVFIGLPLALSWPRAGFVVRGVFLAEVIATTFRVGWLYLQAPQRLCSNYLLGDQQWLGKILLTVGMAIIIILVGKVLCGHIDSLPDSSPNNRTQP